MMFVYLFNTKQIIKLILMIFVYFILFVTKQVKWQTNWFIVWYLNSVNINVCLFYLIQSKYNGKLAGILYLNSANINDVCLFYLY